MKKVTCVVDNTVYLMSWQVSDDERAGVRPGHALAHQPILPGFQNGEGIAHLATGLIVGYPPCPYIHTFKNFLEERYGPKVVMGTYPIP